MLTKEKIQSILNHPQTMEDRLLKAIYEAGGLITVPELIKSGQWDKTTILTTVKKSFYITSDRKGTLTLNYKGKKYEGLYGIPERADNLDNMVFSLLYNNYGLSFQDSLQRVINFCTAKGIKYDSYLRNRNCFDTIKKKVKKYLDTKLKLKPENWSDVSIETLTAWKAREERKGGRL